MQDFHYLDVWHKAHAFTLNIYRITEAFPKVETFGLAASLRRGAAAISIKIAEGCGRDTDAEFVDCLQRARGMGMDVEYQLLLSHDLHFIEPASYEVLQGQVIEVRKMLSGFVKTLGAQPL